MSKIEVFDPAMCCPTGVCGPNVDSKLVQFAADLEWLKGKGVQVERHNLAQQPDKFADCKPVIDAMSLAGDLCLPLILVDGEIVSRNTYPIRTEPARLAGVNAEQERQEPAPRAIVCKTTYWSFPEVFWSGGRHPCMA